MQENKPENSFKSDDFYNIAEIAHIPLEYDLSQPNVRTQISKSFYKKIANNTDAQNEEIKALLEGNEKLLNKFEYALKQIKKQRENESSMPQTNPKKNESHTQTDDFNQMLRKKMVYRIAEALTNPKIDLSSYNVTDKESLNLAAAEIKAILKKRMEDEDQHAKDKNDLADKPELKREYEKIEKENKTDTATEDKTITINEIQEEEEGEEQTEGTTPLDWKADAINKLKQSAEECALMPDFTPPQENASPVNCKLSKDNNFIGLILLDSPKNAKISDNSDFKAYQVLVKFAVKDEKAIRFGNLKEAQKLMLYAAVLASTDTYQSGDKVLAVNPPVLSNELLKSDLFTKQLPPEVQQILKKKYIEDYTNRVKKLREIAQNPEAYLSPEELAKRKAKKFNSDKIMAARLGIIPEYKTTYHYDHKEYDKKGKITNTHAKGSARVVKEDKTLFKGGKLDESRVSKERFDALMKRKTEFERE